jgi:para-nitrobenzyl esterase
MPVYGFDLNQPDPALFVPLRGLPDMTLGDTHTAELAYVFGIDANGPLKASPHRELSQTVIGYWTNFARSGSPNLTTAEASTPLHEGRPYWPPYRDPNPALLSLSTPVALRSGSDFDQDHHCALWDSIRTP